MRQKLRRTYSVANIFALAACVFASSAHAQKATPSIASAPAPSVAPSAAATVVGVPPAYGYPTPPAPPLLPFFGSMVIVNNIGSVGVSRGQLAVTTITLTNYDTSAQQVYLFEPVFAASGAKCGDAVASAVEPHFQIYLQPLQTLVIPYSTPLVFRNSTPNCLAAEVATLLNGGSVEIDVTGYQQFGITYPK